jgi:alkanesulfonate monooxygenase SsuD/methylene tetrahydromethanopterin reductase-like flavin-dependent oxidoreductase (luciferase family)
MFRCEWAPEALVPFAREVENLGYDELWIVEDCFYAAGIVSAATALAVTSRIMVGIGILPAVLRNPALTAMELAALERLFPGRLLPGLGHGMADWMRQVGAFPDSQLAALGETTRAVRALLAGETVTQHGRHVHLDGVRLDHPPAAAPPIAAGVRGPRSLRMSGREADGTILTELSSTGYVRWAREQIDAGRAEAGRTDPHRVTVYAMLDAGGPDRATVRAELAGMLRAGVVPQVRGDDLAWDDPADLSDGFVHAVSVSDDLVSGVDALVAAGADAVVLRPPPDPDAAVPHLRSAIKVLG